MNRQLNAFLREKISHYLKDTQQNMWTLARKAGVPLALIDKLSKGEDVECRYRTTSKILFVVDPVNARSILMEFSPESLKVRGIRDEDPVNNQHLMDNVLVKVLKSRINYLVHSLCSTKLGCAKSRIEEALGIDGLESLHYLLKENILVQRDDGVVYDPLFDTMQTDERQIAQMIRYNLDIFDPEHMNSGIINVVDGYSETGLRKLGLLMRNVRAEILGLQKDPSNLGSHAAFASLLVGNVVPWMDSGEPRPIFRKSYNMDHETAELVSNIAHDMRSPFKKVMEFINEYSDMSNGITDVTQAKRAAKRVDLMIDSLRRLQSHEIVVRQMNIFRLKPILEFAQTLASESGKILRYDGVGEILGYLDEEKVERLIQNLLVNAFEAAKSIVVFTCSREEDALRLVVEDDGQGVPEAYASRLFERGFTLGKRDGTGIGLYNVKTISQGHDGDVYYERVDGNTRFSSILRNVFSTSKLESNLINEGDDNISEGCSKSGKLIFFKARCTDELQNIIESSIPDYMFTSKFEDMDAVTLVCTDEAEIAFEASQLDNVRVWLLPPGMVEKKEFIPAFRDLANQVYGLRN